MTLLKIFVFQYKQVGLDTTHIHIIFKFFNHPLEISVIRSQHIEEEYELNIKKNVIGDLCVNTHFSLYPSQILYEIPISS